MNVTDRFMIEALLHTFLDVSLEGTQPSAPVMHAWMWPVRERKLSRVRWLCRDLVRADVILRNSELILTDVSESASFEK